MLKPSISSHPIEPIAGAYNNVYFFSKGISPEVNVIVRLEFELAYSDVSVLYMSQNVCQDISNLPQSLA